jgi:hypothetical protein
MTKIRTKTRNLIWTGTLVSVIAFAAISLGPGLAQRMLPTAYAATATGGSAITEGACSTGSFADDSLASLSSSCGPNFSNSASGDVVLCMSDQGSISIGIKGTCSSSN